MEEDEDDVMGQPPLEVLTDDNLPAPAEARLLRTIRIFALSSPADRPIADRRKPRDSAAFRFWLSTYSAVSFLWLFIVNMSVEFLVYRRLTGLRPKLTEQIQPFPSRTVWLFERDSLFVTTYHIRFDYLNTPSSILFSSVVLGLAVLIFWFVWKNESTSRRRWLFGMMAVYILAPYVSMLAYRDMTGMKLAAPIFLCLFFVIRGTRRFNPHWEMHHDGTMSETKVHMLLLALNRYFLTTVAVVGFVAMTLLTGAHRMINDIFSRTGPNADIYHSIELPLIYALIGYAVFGCISLAAGVSRELHIKFHEVLLIPTVTSGTAKRETGA